MRNCRPIAYLVALLLLPYVLIMLTTRDVLAQERKPWLAVTGMLNNYSMSEVNQTLEELGMQLLGVNVIGDIPVSLGFGAALGLDVSAQFAASLAYDRYLARSSGDGVNSDLQPGRVEVEMSLPANAVYGTVEYRHQGGQGSSRSGQSSWSVGAGVSGGVIWMNGESIISIEGEATETTTITGSAPLVKGFLAADIWRSPRIGFSPSIGYRYAKVDNPETTTNGVVVPNSTSTAVDYSGFYVQIALKFALP